MSPPEPRDTGIVTTPRLLLIPVTEATLHAEPEPERLGRLLHVSVPPTWPPDHWDARAVDFLDRRIRRYPEMQGWARYIALRQSAGELPVLIGGCGCTEPPQLREDVEIGYSILAEQRGHGYVTEAVRAFLPWIFSFPNVHSVCAQSYPHHAETLAVLHRCGFTMDGPGKTPGTVLMRRSRLPVPPS